MSRQIAVRLPDDIASFVDAQVSSGRAPSRAAVVTRALEQERRRQQALADIEILKLIPESDDLDKIAEHASRLSIDRD